MIVKVDSWLYRLLFALPLWLPYSIESVKVGYDGRSYVRINWREPK